MAVGRESQKLDVEDLLCTFSAPDDRASHCESMVVRGTAVVTAVVGGTQTFNP